MGENHAFTDDPIVGEIPKPVDPKWRAQFLENEKRYLASRLRKGDRLFLYQNEDFSLFVEVEKLQDATDASKPLMRVNVEKRNINQGKPGAEAASGFKPVFYNALERELHDRFGRAIEIVRPVYKGDRDMAAFDIPAEGSDEYLAHVEILTALLKEKGFKEVRRETGRGKR